MKVKVIIENGKTQLILCTENDFEKDVLEKVYDQNLTMDASVTSDYTAFALKRDSHKIRIVIEDKKE